jgi:predicted enzyme related to lactoylglutathione lyase|tara:strand:- start:3029 stop:3583 length:555 start_codon:yes stop_codon:yes gene_type:complete
MAILVIPFRMISVVGWSLSVFLGFNYVAQAEDQPVFSKATVDLGIVVSDLKQAAKFYIEVVGMKEVPGFKVPGKRVAQFGLTDNQPVVARRFVLNDGKDSSSLKLMAFPNAPGKRPSQKFIHSTLGFSYLTLFVNDMAAAVERAKKAGVKMLGETPSQLGGDNYLAVYRDPDGNFIELIGPMKK